MQGVQGEGVFRESGIGLIQVEMKTADTSITKHLLYTCLFLKTAYEKGTVPHWLDEKAKSCFTLVRLSYYLPPIWEGVWI